MSAGAARIAVRVARITAVTDQVKRFRFERRDGQPMPVFSGGAHVVVEMEIAGVRRMNPYSLMSDPGDTSGHEISVRRDDAGRGGSLHLHRTVREGDEMVISHPVNLFALDLRARKHLMIAGGIGITPFIAQTAQLAARGGWFELHYASRSPGLCAYGPELVARHGRAVQLYHDDAGQRIDLARLLATQPLGTHLYVCGPKPMIAWVLQSARAAGWPESALHHEEFLAPPPGQVFEARLAASGISVQVGTHQSLLEAIEAAGVQAPYLCRGGACGECETRVLACDGALLHNDHWLTDAQKAEGGHIMPCVSRFAGRSLVLDR